MYLRALRLTQRDGLLVLADLLVGMKWRCFSLDACLVVVVAGSFDVLRAGSSSRARQVEQKRFQRQAADLSDALYW